MRHRHLLTLAPLLLLGQACSSSPEPIELRSRDAALLRFNWMVGSWVSEDGGSSWSEEHWIPPAGGVMLGVNRSVEAGTTRFFEYLRIENRPEGIFYVAMPAGRQPTDFKLVSVTGMSATFENAEHDFPNRIIYSGDGESRLRARVEGTQRGRPHAEEWKWRRATIVWEKD